MKNAKFILLCAGLVLMGLIASPNAIAAPITASSLASLQKISIQTNAPGIAPAAQGCSGSPSISYFSATPPVISNGQVSTLQWGLVANASSAFLATPSGTNGIGTPGSQQVKPTQTTTYTLIAYCGNVSVQAVATVTVQNSSTCTGTPQISSFTANPGTINAGQTSTLQWGLVGNASSVSLQTPNGTSGVATPGSVQVQPGQTTTYFLNAWCQGVMTQAQATVTVNNAPLPPPPAPGNQILGMSINGGLSNSSQTVLTVNYFWNGEDAPANLQGFATNNGAKSNATRINANQNFNANLNFPVPVSQFRQANVCIFGASGTELVCRTGP